MSWCTSIVQLHLVAGFKSESDTYFSPHMVRPLFYLPLLSMPLSPHCTLVLVTVLVRPQTTLAKMSKKQKSLESFFEKGERPSNEIAEDSKTANKKKAALKKNCQESNLNLGFIAINDSHSLSPLCTICGDWLSSKATKPSNYFVTWRPSTLH